ncbi:MAG: hypothetical protein QXR60_05310 [Candidatus Nanoarchaeia archaeon]
MINQTIAVPVVERQLRGRSRVKKMIAMIVSRSEVDRYVVSDCEVTSLSL